MTATEPTLANSQGLDPTFEMALQRMIEDSGGRLYINSGFRDHDTQQRLWNEAVKKYGPGGARAWVAPPGHSNHERGLAADLGGDLDWAKANAPRYGLVFPLSNEAWHIEPVNARDSASRDAYATGGTYGVMNPVDDPNWMSRPDVLLATFSAALSGDPTVAPEQQLIDAGLGDLNPSGGAGSVPSGTTSGGGSTTGNVTPEQVYAALKAAGLSPAQAAALTSIAGRESGFNTGAYNGNRATGDDSHGLFQINLLNGGWGPTLQAHGVDPNSLNTLEGAAAAAKVLVDASGGRLTPWGGYKGQPWYYGGVDMSTGVNASGGEVSLSDLQALS